MTTLSTTESYSLLREILRFRAALVVAQKLEQLCFEHLHTSASDAKGLFSAAVFEGQQHAAARADATSFEGVNESSGNTTVVTTGTGIRTWVHPIIDVRRRAVVQAKVSPTSTIATTRYTLTGVQYVKGDILGVVEPVSEKAEAAAATHTCVNSTQTRTMPLRELCLSTPEPLYDDALLPALEAIEPHHASKNLLDLWLNKLCGATDKMNLSFNQKRKKAWHLADEATYLFYVARKKLAEQLPFVSLQESPNEGAAICEVNVSLQASDAQLCRVLGLPVPSTAPRVSSTTTTAVVVEVSWNADVTEGNSVREWLSPVTSSAIANLGATNESEVSWTTTTTEKTGTSKCAPTTRLVIPVTADAVLRLHRRYQQANSNSSTSEVAQSFLPALAKLLLRYHALSGGQMNKASGRQAALPSQVMDTFENYPVVSEPFSDNAVGKSKAAQICTVECFASPFNATRRFFFSAFHDTDAAFGSLGSFFACRSPQGCVEAIGAAAKKHTLTNYGEVASASTILRLECNPPFDHEVIAGAFTQLLKWLHDAPPSLALSILVIIPDSTQAHASEVRAGAEQSPLCRWLRSVPAHHCLYVHGAQQQQVVPLRHRRKRAREAAEDDDTPSNAPRLIKLLCPTRVLVLQNEAAEKLCVGAAIGEEVTKVWRSISVGASSQ